MATKKERAWYADKLGKIGIVEKVTNIITKDGYTSDWASITEAKAFRIYAISRDDDLSDTDLTNTFNQIPIQFHEAIVYKVIANGYKDTRNQKFDAAQYFDNNFRDDLGVDSGLHIAILEFVKHRLEEDLGNIQKSAYFLQKYKQKISTYPHSRKGTRGIKLPPL